MKPEGFGPEGGTVRIEKLALEVLGVPYTGSDVLSSALAMDKLKAKELFRLHNVPTPPYYVVGREDLDCLVDEHGDPLPAIRNSLDNAGLSATVIETGATLEDVFVAVTMDRQDEAA